jgi:pyridoxamine 5'-phosphate oxidase
MWIDAELKLEADPRRSFDRWYAAAEAADPQPQAMALATVDGAGQPHARMVLFRGWSEGGLRFFTNYTSGKGGELAANARAALLFYWQPLHRQVRIEGTVERLARAESEAYFASRDRESRLGAWASRQSTPIASRAALEQRMEAMRARFGKGNGKGEGKSEGEEEEVPCPPFWGGYRLRPALFEFWQNRPNRLHDRFRYLPAGEGWRAERLSP